MKFVFFIFFFILGNFSYNSLYAGTFQMTVHSRANCINNESITWWANHPNNWRVVSVHYKGSMQHTIDTGYMIAARVAAVHFGEGNSGGWSVWGYHFDANSPNSRYAFAITNAVDCHIGDGWF